MAKAGAAVRPGAAPVRSLVSQGAASRLQSKKQVNHVRFWVGMAVSGLLGIGFVLLLSSLFSGSSPPASQQKKAAPAVTSKEGPKAPPPRKDSSFNADDFRGTPGGK